ncbi:MAG: hypothetical protein ABGY41_00510 [Candidatus Poribacteria bacterium]
MSLITTLVIGFVAQASLFAQSPLPSASGAPVPLPAGARRRMVFAFDQSAAMDRLDPDRLRVEGVRKLLFGLGPADTVAMVVFGGGPARVAVPLSAATDATVGSILREAVGSMVADGPIDLNGALNSALRMLPPDDGVVSSVVVVSSARFREGADVDSARSTLRRSANKYINAGVDIYVIAMGPYADQAQGLAAGVRNRPDAFEVETGNGLPPIFGKILARAQGYGKRPVLARLDPDSPTVSKQRLDEIVKVAPYTELLQIDVVSEADEAGVIGFEMGLENPAGEAVLPVFQGRGNAFFRIPWPMHGDWRYRVVPERKARITHQVITDNGLKIVNYCPAVVEFAKGIPLYFAVLTPQGAVDKDTFKIGESSYQFARAEVTFLAPDGTSETVQAKLQGRQADYPGEYMIKTWRGEQVGAYDVDIAIYLRRERDLKGELYEMHNLAPITIEVVDDRMQLPVVSLASVKPIAEDPTRPINLTDAAGRAPALDFYAEVLKLGAGSPSPFMLGRTIVARVERGEGYKLGSAAGLAELTGRIRTVGKSSVLLMPDTTVAHRVQYGFPTLITPSKDRIYFNLAGYYKVSLVNGPTYRVDPARASVVRQVGDEPLSFSALVMLAIGGLISVFGGAIYLLIEWGKVDLAPRRAPELPDEVLIEDEQTFETFTDVFDENLFDMPQNIPLEIAVFEQGMLTNHTFFDTEERSENYIVKVIKGSAYINGSPVTDDFDLHMRPEDQFQVGDFKAGIQGIEEPHLVIQFMVEEVGDSTVIHVITEGGVNRWTITSNPDKRMPPQPGESLTLNFTEQEELFIARDEGLEYETPMDIALFHESVGAPHAKFTKQTYLNGSVGYGIEAIRGSVYVNDNRIEPGEAVEEFSPGTTLRIGRFLFKFTWEQGPDAQHPVMEVIEAPDPIPMPLADGSDVTADALAAAAAAGEDDAEETLDALFADTDSDDDDADGDDTPAAELDALEEGGSDSSDAVSAEASDVSAEDPSDEASDDLDALMDDADATELDELDVLLTGDDAEAEGLDEMLAASASDEAPAGEDAPGAGEEASDVVSDAGDGPVVDDAPAVDEASELDDLMADSVDEASSPDDDDESATGNEPSESAVADATGEAPSLEALVGEAQGDDAGPDADSQEEAPQVEDAGEAVDAETGLPTAARFAEQLRDDWDAAERSEVALSVILVDAGRIETDGEDSAAVQVATVLSGDFGAAGTLAHAGENLFALLLTSVPLDEAIEVAGLVQTALRDALPASAEQITLGVSERRGSRAEDAESYVQSLREAMDEGVAAGQNFVVYG